MKRILIAALTAILVFSACQRENMFPENQGPASLEDFYENNRSAGIQSFLVNNTSGGLMTTEKGVKIHFPANGFVTESGTPVTGNVSIAVKEILTPAEMILNNMPTMSDGKALESGGEFHIKVTKDGQSLKLAPGNYLQIAIPQRPGINMNDMQVFNGARDADGNVNWIANTNPGNFVVPDSSLFYYSNLFCDSVNWINCDKFYNEPTVQFSVYPGNAPSNDSTNVFVHLSGRNSVVRMNWTQGMSYFTSNQVLPVASTIVGISVRNGQLYASLIPVNVQDGQSVTLNFSAYTESQLRQLLAQLQ